WAEADVTVDAALEAGAVGARMTGGGFGGSVIALVPAELSGAVSDAVEAQFRRRGWRPPAVTPVVPSQGASRVR
nr:galactokinase [Streptosporangiaceae bacterium]